MHERDFAYSGANAIEMDLNEFDQMDLTRLQNLLCSRTNIYQFESTDGIKSQ